MRPPIGRWVSHYAHLWLWASAAVGGLAAAGIAAAGVVALASGALGSTLVFGALSAWLGTRAYRSACSARERAGGAARRRAVARELGELGRVGWRLRHGVRWPDGRRLSHLALAPGGDLVFAIESAETDAELDARASWLIELSGWLELHGRPVVPVLVAGPSRAEELRRGVLVCGRAQICGALDQASLAFHRSRAGEVFE